MQGILELADQDDDRWTWSRRDSAERARYRTDYEILNLLGSGGFGRVFKVQNKVDSKTYAMKVVRMDVNVASNKELREVQVLSSITSEHVVRYFSA